MMDTHTSENGTLYAAPQTPPSFYLHYQGHLGLVSVMTSLTSTSTGKPPYPCPLAVRNSLGEVPRSIFLDMQHFHQLTPESIDIDGQIKKIFIYGLIIHTKHHHHTTPQNTPTAPRIQSCRNSHRHHLTDGTKKKQRIS